jgi:hypothetical protein
MFNFHQKTTSMSHNYLIYNKNLLDSIREKLDDLTGGEYVKSGAGTQSKTEKLTDIVIGELLLIPRSTFSDGLKIDGYLTFKLHHLYLALKNHENRYYKQLSSKVFIMSVREVGKYFGITQNNVNDYIQILKFAVSENRKIEISSTNSFVGGIGAAGGVLGSVRTQDVTVNKESTWSKIKSTSIRKAKELTYKIIHHPQSYEEWFDSLPQAKQDTLVEKMMAIVKMQEDYHPQSYDEWFDTLSEKEQKIAIVKSIEKTDFCN